MMMGAHVLRSGVQRYLIDLMQEGHVNCIATNGACVIHDWEFALIGKTTEIQELEKKASSQDFWNDPENAQVVTRRISLLKEVGQVESGGSRPHDHDLHAPCLLDNRP